MQPAQRGRVLLQHLASSSRVPAAAAAAWCCSSAGSVCQAGSLQQALFSKQQQQQQPPQEEALQSPSPGTHAPSSQLPRAQQQQQHQHAWRQLPWQSSHLWQQQEQQQRHYRTQPRTPAAARRRGPPLAYAASESDSDSDELDMGLQRGAARQGSYQQRQRQWRRQRQQQQQQQAPDDDFQQEWRQQWHRQSAQQDHRQRLPISRDEDPRGGSSRYAGGRGGSSSSRSSRHIRGQHDGPEDDTSSRWQTAKRPTQFSRPRAAVDAIGITKAIGAAGSLQALQKLLQQHKDHLQQIHICAAYKAVVKLSVGLRDKPPLGSSSSQADRQQPAQEDFSSSSSSSSSGGGGGSSRDSSSNHQQPLEGSTALEVLRDLSSRMQQQIRVARPWDLAQAAWACSKLQYRDQRLLEAIAQQAQRKAAILTPQDISQLASAYARLSYQQPQLLQLLQVQAEVKANDFKPWALVHTAWALHVCGQNVLQLLTVAVPLLRDPEQLKQLNALDMSSLLWLLAGHSLYDEALLQAAGALLAANIPSYSPASVANALMACAALGFTTPALSAAAAATVLSGLQQQRYTPQQVALSVFALAKLKGCDKEVLEAAADAFQRAPQAYSPPLLSMLTWVCVLAKRDLPGGFINQLVQCSRQQLPKFSPDQLASLLRGVFAVPDPQQDSSMSLCRLLAEAQGLLPSKLPAVSTPVLTNLIKSLSKRLHSTSSCSTQQQQTQPHNPGSILTQQPGQEGENEQELLTGMLDECVREWAQPGRVRHLTHWQAVSVERALTACGQESLAAVAGKVAQDVQAAAQEQRGSDAEPLSSPGVSATAAAVQPGATATWVDSFVAGTE